MNAVELIEKKRDRGKLEADEIRWLIEAYTKGSVTDYQMSAMAMAVYLNGLDADELAVWTDAMLHSGEVLEFDQIPIPKADKHSTGGVGDKISIPLGPIVAACGVAVPMISGRGLGHTGGTLDKLESISGFRTALEPSEFAGILAQTNLVLAGQSQNLVPADRRLYALRDATGTVSSIPLISSSIMSKKLAEGLDALVLDVKFGSGAFMQELDQARLLAQTMVGIGKANGVATVALLTNMEVPLGLEIGNAGEIRESIAVLKGEGPPDVTELTLALGAEELVLTGVCETVDDAKTRMRKVIEDGSAFDVFVKVVELQGGDVGMIHDPEKLPIAPHTYRVDSPADGYIGRLDARQLGVAAMRLGAGRERSEDTIDPAVGITIKSVYGAMVKAGDPILELQFRHPARLEEALRTLAGAFEIQPDPPPVLELVVERIE